jgi:hypothetical protein
MIHRDHRRVQRRRFYIDLDLARRAGISGPPFHCFSHADTLVWTLAIKGLTMVEVDMTAVGEFPAYYPFNQKPAV